MLLKNGLTDGKDWLILQQGTDFYAYFNLIWAAHAFHAINKWATTVNCLGDDFSGSLCNEDFREYLLQEAGEEIPKLVFKAKFYLLHLIK